MKSFTMLLAASLAVAASFATPQSVDAQSRIRCESQNNRTQTCRIDNVDIDSIRLVNRLSQSPCINGTSWGADASGIWVSGGCRAEFQYEQRRGAGGGIREVTCESNNGNREECRITGLNERSVRLVNRLSQSACVNGQSWGTRADMIWVGSGCRAVFEYEAGGGGLRRGESQANMSAPRQTLTCESQNNRRQTCSVRNLDLGSVRVERNLSRTPCNKDQNWGAQRGQIWVSGGCRAEFSFRVNDET